MLNWNIIKTDNHYSVYIEDQFYCSSDTWIEACDEVENLLEESRIEQKCG